MRRRFATAAAKAALPIHANVSVVPGGLFGSFSSHLMWILFILLFVTDAGK